VGFDLYCQLLKQSVSALKGQKVKPRVEVQTRIDFIISDPAEAATESPKSKVQGPRSVEIAINVPRETATYVAAETPSDDASHFTHHVSRAPAYLPLNYISDSRQRIEVYRKLAQVTDKSALEKLGKELRDRFGPAPRAVETLLQVAELKLIASDKAVTIIETKEDKLLLTRGGDLLTFGSKLPRLTKAEPVARLKEIKKVLLALH
jgi:transcription-repair coupling factor (superfamily II helicase)